MYIPQYILCHLQYLLYEVDFYSLLKMSLLCFECANDSTALFLYEIPKIVQSQISMHEANEKATEHEDGWLNEC